MRTITMTTALAVLIALPAPAVPATDCGGCHLPQRTAWTRSLHARSTTDPLSAPVEMARLERTLDPTPGGR